MTSPAIREDLATLEPVRLRYYLLNAVSSMLTDEGATLDGRTGGDRTQLATIGGRRVSITVTVADEPIPEPQR